MFERLARKIDSYSCRVLLGTTTKKYAWRLRKKNPALTEEEAVQLAAREIIDALRSEEVDATSYSQLNGWAQRFLLSKNTSPPALRLFPVGEYKLDTPVSGLAGLKEFSVEEYAVMGRHFEGETAYNAPPVDLLGRQWQLQLGTVAGKIYKIAPYLLIKTKQEADSVAMESLRYCTERLGKPTQQQTGLFVWDASDGNAVLQTADLDEEFYVSIFLTSRAVQTFKRT